MEIDPFGDGVHFCWTDEGLQVVHCFPKFLCKEEKWASADDDLHYHTWTRDAESNEWKRCPTQHTMPTHGGGAIPVVCRTPCPGTGVAPNFLFKHVAIEGKWVRMRGWSGI